MSEGKITVTVHASSSGAWSQAVAYVAYQGALAKAHRRGEHPYGSMRRACPLCARGAA